MLLTQTFPVTSSLNSHEYNVPYFAEEAQQQGEVEQCALVTWQSAPLHLCVPKTRKDAVSHTDRPGTVADSDHNQSYPLPASTTKQNR